MFGFICFNHSSMVYGKDSSLSNANQEKSSLVDGKMWVDVGTPEDRRVADRGLGWDAGLGDLE